jgi:F-type H+-transporting ATPase subunit epsilon
MSLKVSVISPEASLFEGDADSVVVPAYDGEIGILSGHAPLMTLLGKGELRISGAAPRKFTIEGGFLQVVNNQVRVVTERGSAT